VRNIRRSGEKPVVPQKLKRVVSLGATEIAKFYNFALFRAVALTVVSATSTLCDSMVDPAASP